MRALRPLAFLRRLGRESGGATAVEFALVITPFLFMLFSIFEIGRIYTVASVLEDATMDAGRMVRTGEIQMSGGDVDAFRDEVCARMSVFAGGCDTSLTVDVRVVPSFAEDAPPSPISEGEFEKDDLVFEPGNAQEIVLVRTWWRTPLFAPMITQGLVQLSDGSTVVSTATTFRSEPYQ
jgi:Flp pilus assembly protein TadG